jgi:hypothetical protein
MGNVYQRGRVPGQGGYSGGITDDDKIPADRFRIYRSDGNGRPDDRGRMVTVVGDSAGRLIVRPGELAELTTAIAEYQMRQRRGSPVISAGGFETNRRKH